MMVRMTCWPVLLTISLLVAGPAWAQTEDGNEAPDVVVDAAESAEEEVDEAVAEDEIVEADETVDESDPEDITAEATDSEPVEEPQQQVPTEDELAHDEHTQETGVEEPAVPQQAPPVETGVQEQGGVAIAHTHTGPQANVQVLGNQEDGDNWSLFIGGYFRTGFTHIQADETYELFGRNDGFVMSDARLITRGEMDNGLGFILSLDAGSRLVRTTPDSPVQELAVRMTDAYVYYQILDYLEFNLGQFKAPFDAEDLISSANLLFVNRSVANRGIQDVEGFNVRGLSQGRQLGLQARGRYDIIEDGLGVSYAAAVANGNGPNRSLNENDRLGYYGRLALHWGDIVALGGGAFHNDGTFGDPPNQVDRLRTGWTADLQFRMHGVSLLANVVSETRSVPDLEQEPETTGLGYQVQVAYEEPLFGFQPAYRFASFDPYFEHGGDNADDFFEDSALTYHTLGLNYNAQEYPVRLMANYTIAIEEDETRQLDNNRLDLLLQLQW